MDLKSGYQTPVSGCTLKSLLATDSWGQLWRAQHSQHGNVIVALYVTSEGRQLVGECLKHWKRWKELADSGTCPELLPIHQIVENGDILHVVIRDPGGQTVREMASQGAMGVRGAVAAATGIAAAIIHSTVYDIPLVNVCPDTAISGDLQGKIWKLLPIAPNAVEHGALLWGGRYVPPDARPDADLSKLKPDVYGLNWLLADLISGDYSGARDPGRLRNLIPYSRLRTLISNGVTPRSGTFGDPKLVQLGLDHWMKKDAEEDLEEYRKAQQAAQGKAPPPALQFYLDNKRRVHQAAVALAVVLLIVIGLFAVPSIFKTKNTERTPYGITNLFLQAMVDRNASKALSYTTGEAQGVVAPMLAEIDRLESEHKASRFAKGVPRVAGDGDARTVKVDLKGESGDLFMNAEMTIRQQADGNWRVEQLFYKTATDR